MSPYHLLGDGDLLVGPGVDADLLGLLACHLEGALGLLSGLVDTFPVSGNSDVIDPRGDR